MTFFAAHVLMIVALVLLGPAIYYSVHGEIREIATPGGENLILYTGPNVNDQLLTFGTAFGLVGTTCGVEFERRSTWAAPGWSTPIGHYIRTPDGEGILAIRARSRARERRYLEGLGTVTRAFLAFTSLAFIMIIGRSILAWTNPDLSYFSPAPPAADNTPLVRLVNATRTSVFMIISAVGILLLVYEFLSRRPGRVFWQIPRKDGDED